MRFCGGSAGWRGSFVSVAVFLFLVVFVVVVVVVGIRRAREVVVTCVQPEESVTWRRLLLLAVVFFCFCLDFLWFLGFPWGLGGRFWFGVGWDIFKWWWLLWWYWWDSGMGYHFGF